MPVFAAFVGQLFTALGVFLARLFLARLAIKLAGVAAIVACGTVLMTTFNGVVAPLASQLFSTQYGQLLGLAFPPVSGTCVAGITAVWAACGLYAIQMRSIHSITGV